MLRHGQKVRINHAMYPGNVIAVVDRLYDGSLPRPAYYVSFRWHGKDTINAFYESDLAPYDGSLFEESLYSYIDKELNVG